MTLNKSICIHSNETDASKRTFEELTAKLTKNGYLISDKIDSDTGLLICIGGDGAMLDALHKFDFPKVPVIGINTGHLGFFQEVESHKLDEFISNYETGKYRLQPLSTVKAIIILKTGMCATIRALNEIIIRSDNYQSAHLALSIDGSFIENFSGDGLVIATSAGSTAYNYSIGGAIVDPRLNLLQVTPIAPMNTTAYRSFTSSILLPHDLHLDIVPISHGEATSVLSDGECITFDDVESIKVSVSETEINLLRFETYDFWHKIKTKFL